MNVVQLILGLGLGMGLMAIVHEVCRWDGERRRLAAELGVAAAAPAGAPAGRHCRSDDTLGIASDAFAAGLAARDTGPMSADPAGHGWRRPSAMIPVQPSMLPDVGILPVLPMPARAHGQDAPVWQETWAPQGAGDSRRINGHDYLAGRP